MTAADPAAWQALWHDAGEHRGCSPAACSTPGLEHPDYDAAADWAINVLAAAGYSPDGWLPPVDSFLFGGRPARPEALEAPMPVPTTTGPVFDCRHDHPISAVTGYDVVRTTGIGDTLTVEVVARIDGGRRYGEALSAARALRVGDAWGTVCHRWDGCGCRWVATLLQNVRGERWHELVADAGA